MLSLSHFFPYSFVSFNMQFLSLCSVFGFFIPLSSALTDLAPSWELPLLNDSEGAWLTFGLDGYENEDLANPSDNRPYYTRANLPRLVARPTRAYTYVVQVHWRLWQDLILCRLIEGLKGSQWNLYVRAHLMILSDDSNTSVTVSSGRFHPNTVTLLQARGTIGSVQ